MNIFCLLVESDYYRKQLLSGYQWRPASVCFDSAEIAGLQRHFFLDWLNAFRSK